MARLRQYYVDTVKKALQEKFNFSNPMEIPRIEKIVINMGVGEAAQDSKRVNAAAKQLEQIAGQKPLLTKARKSIAGFKVREGMKLGTKVTLRKSRMYEFLDRLVNIALPRIRDFRGLSPKGFDGRGNYNFGIKEQLVFPEINYDEVDQVRGMDINIVTTARTNNEGLELLKAFNLPLEVRG